MTSLWQLQGRVIPQGKLRVPTYRFPPKKAAACVGPHKSGYVRSSRPHGDALHYFVRGRLAVPFVPQQASECHHWSNRLFGTIWYLVLWYWSGHHPHGRIQTEVLVVNQWRCFVVRYWKP